MSTSPSNHLQCHQKSLQLERHLTDKSNMSAQLSRRYDQLLCSEKYHDCVFHTGGIAVKCHKLILSAASPVFEAMFYGPIREKQQDIEILDISPDIFKVLLRYIYAGIVDFEQLTLEDTVELYYGAEKYWLNGLITDCLLAITRKLRFSNILPALELSVCLDLKDLLEVCMTFFKRCCLKDPQYLAYLKTHYLHISKECIKMIIASSGKDMHKQLLWFVQEWCQQECNELGFQRDKPIALIIDDLHLKESDIKGALLTGTNLTLAQQHCKAIERNFYKACRPLTIDYDAHEYKIIVKCDHFISLLGIIMHSRLTPNITTLAHFSNEYNECLQIEISAADQTEDEVIEQQQQELNPNRNCSSENVIWKHSVSKQPTKYNCDLNIGWNEGVILSPDVAYQIKLTWQANAYGAEYPCSLLSNIANGIHFNDCGAQNGSLIKGLRFFNLV